MDNSDLDASMNDVQDQSMMDSMDDLFGEANDAMNVNVNIALPAISPPPPPGLVKRISDLQASGACT